MIYIVEDDPNIRELVSYALQTSGLPAAGFADGAAFWQAVAQQTPELVLLDIMLPGEDGISILKKLKHSPETAQIPVIMMTAKGEEYDKVLGLDAGADDYVAKPFGMMELLSRIRAVLRRTTAPAGEPERGEVLQAGRLTLDPIRHQVKLDGREINLTLKEFAVLHLLMARRGAVITRDELLQQVWGYDYGGETRTVDVHVGTLRQKLGECSGYVETVRGIGYRLGGLGR
ncbi:MAG: response regulator transcription factor [Clostridiales bacterium]|nr:response regulator transcription factor [Clostridiales bacterium]